MFVQLRVAEELLESRRAASARARSPAHRPASGTPSRRPAGRSARPERSSCHRSSSCVFRPSMIGTFGPYMSPSSSATRLPSLASATARLTAIVVLPTPPLPAPTAMMFLTPSTGVRPSSGRPTARTCAVISTATDETPGIAETTRPGLIPQQILHGTRRRRELDDERDCAALDVDVLDEVERDDVLVEVGVLHCAQGIEHRGFSDGHVLILLRTPAVSQAGRRVELSELAFGEIPDVRELVTMAIEGLNHQERPRAPRRPSETARTGPSQAPAPRSSARCATRTAIRNVTVDCIA